MGRTSHLLPGRALELAAASNPEFAKQQNKVKEVGSDGLPGHRPSRKPPSVYSIAGNSDLGHFTHRAL